MRQWLIIGVIDLHESPPTQQVREAICTVMDQLSKNSRHVAVVSGAISDCESVFVQEAKRRSCPTLMVLPMHFESLCQHVSSDKASWIQAVVRESIYIDMAESSPNLADGLREADVLTVDRADAIGHSRREAVDLSNIAGQRNTCILPRVSQDARLNRFYIRSDYV
jgi:hypothetical protein